MAESLFGETGRNILKGAKFAISIKDASKGLANLTIELADGKEIMGTVLLILLKEMTSITY